MDIIYAGKNKQIKKIQHCFIIKCFAFLWFLFSFLTSVDLVKNRKIGKRDLIVVLKRCGLPVPWLNTSHSNVSTTLYLTYDVLVAIIVLYTIFSYIYTLTSTSLSFQDLCAIGICGGCNLCGLLVTAHHVLYNDHLHQLTHAMDAISKAIISSDLEKKEEFLKEYERNSKIINILAKYSFILSFTTPFFYFLSLPVIEWYTGNYRTHLPLPISNFFNDRLPGVYELIVLIIAGSISISTATKAAYDCLFIALLKIQTTYFKYLYETQDIIRKDLRENGKTQHRFVAWVKLHQEIIKNNEELVQTFSPIIIIYYLIVIEIVVCGAFVESKKDNDNLVQSISVGSYVMITILYYFLLSNTADELNIEAEKLAFVAYTLPWYRMKKSNISMLRLVVTMSNKPRELTAYRAPVFLLNREMFVGFIVAAASAFVTFCKMGSSSDTDEII